MGKSGRAWARVGEHGQGPIMHASGFGKPERGVLTYNVGGCTVEDDIRLGQLGVGWEFELGVGLKLGVP